MPYDWAPGPVYSIGNGCFLIDNSSNSGAWEATSLQSGVPAPPGFGGGDGGTNSSGGGPIGYVPTYTTSDLWLEITGISGSIASLVVHPPSAELGTGVYDLFMTTNLNSNVPGLNLTNWLWILRTTPGETDLTVSNLPADQAFFILARTNDSDGDGLSDAYERLVSHTNPYDPDTDHDGLSDSLELQLGTDPNNAYSQDKTHRFKDGEWYLTSVTGQTGTRADLYIDPFDNYYDYYDDITIVTFALIGGVTTNDQFDIYIQTPSVDPSDTNLVWQDMFRFLGYAGPIYETGIIWYQTAWPGYVPLDGSVQFGALDSQDRDSDGLQDGYEVFVTHTIAGAPSSDMSGVADGDGNPANDGLSNLQKWEYGLNPMVAVSTSDSSGTGLPDWFTNYITYWYGPGNVDPWADPDGDGLPNIVEYEIGSDPVFADYWAYFQPPPGDESQQFASFHITASYSDSDGPNNNPYFPMFGNVAGPLGAGGSMNAETSGAGVGTATLDFEIWPLDKAYDFYAPFTATADPSQCEFQEPNPTDGDLYREILLNSTDLARDVWTHVNENVLEALSSQTLEYLHAVSMLKIERQVRLIQYDQYLLTQGANSSAIFMRMRTSASIIHTEVTKVTAIDIQYIRKYPSLDWISRSLTAAGFLSCAISWTSDWGALMDDIQGYESDVRNHTDTGAADLLSSQIQSMLQALPGLPDWIQIGLDPTIPIFSLNGPLGWYDGY
jgi:hypothetical protein